MNIFRRYLACLAALAIMLSSCVPCVFAEEGETVPDAGTVVFIEPVDTPAPEESAQDAAVITETESVDAPEAADPVPGNENEAGTDGEETDELPAETVPADAEENGEAVPEENIISDENVITDENAVNDENGTEGNTENNTEEDETAADGEEDTGTVIEEPEAQAEYLIPGTIQAGQEGVVFRSFATKDEPEVSAESTMMLFKALRELEVLYVTGSGSMLEVDKDFTWTIACAGGVGPYQFSFNLYYQTFDKDDNTYRLLAGKSGNTGTKLIFSDSNTFTYPVTQYGRYVLRIGVKDENGDTLVWQTGFYTTDTEDEVLSKKVALLKNECLMTCTSEYDKVRWVNETLCRLVTYDAGSTVEYGSYYAFNALVNGKAVCQGYTLAAQILLDELGIENLFVSGRANGAHSWNLVKIGGQWYHLDITWNDTTGNKYFLLPDSVMARDHTWSSSYTDGQAVYPDCTDDRYYQPGIDKFVDEEALFGLLDTAAQGSLTARIIYSGTPSIDFGAMSDSWLRTRGPLYHVKSLEYQTTGKNNPIDVTLEKYTEFKDIADCGVVLNETSLSYTGTNVRAGVTVTDGSVVLTEGSDYMLTYTNDIAVGTAGVTVTGIGMYDGETDLTYTITTASIDDCLITVEDGCVYTGSKVKPAVTVTINGVMLTNGTDYKLTYKNNTLPGTATVTVTGLGNLTGTKKLSFEIACFPITEVFAEEIGSLVWEGTALTPEVVLTWCGNVLTEGTDYTVAYSGNDGVGTGRAIVTGCGVFAGERTLTFEITRMLCSSLTLDQESLTLFVGEGAQLTCEILPVLARGGEVIWETSDSDVASVDADGNVRAQSAGEAVITVKTLDGSGMSDQCLVTVKPMPPEEIVPESTKVTLGLGEKQVINCALLPAGSAAALSYSSSASAIVTVSAAGVMNAKKLGKAVVTITSDNGLTCDINVTVVKAPTSVSVKVSSQKIGVGETVVPSITLSAGAGGNVDVISQSPAVLRVNADGSVTGVSAGKAVLRVQTYNGIKKDLTFTVDNAPTQVALSSENLKLGVGQKYALTAVYDNTWSAPVWECDDVTVVKCDNGNLTALKQGTAHVRVTVGTVTDECTVTVLPCPEEIILSSVSAVIGRLDSVSFTWSFPEGTMGSVTASTSNKSVTDVTMSGNTVTVKGKAVGSATITLTTHTGVKALYKITVKNAPSMIKLSYPLTVLGLGETMKGTVTMTSNTAATLTYTSTDENVLTVDAGGVVTAVGTGKAKIQVKTHTGLKCTTGEITVREAPADVSISGNRADLGAGETGTLTFVLTEGSAGSVRFESSDEAVLKVDAATGKYTAVSKGTAVVTATAYNGVSDQLSVTVLDAPDRIILSSLSGTIGRNDKVSFSYAFPEGTNGSVKVTTSNKNIAEPITEGNTITLKSKLVGTVTITVTAHNGVKATYKLTVKNAPSSVKLAYGRYSVGVGEKLPGSVTLPTNTMASLTFTSLDESVITVDENGTITAVGEGKAKVQVVTHNNVKGTSGEIAVYPAPVSVSLAGGRNEYGVGETGALTSTLSEGSVGEVSYTSSNDSILKVASDGKFTAMAPGRVTVTVKTYNGLNDTGTIDVVPAPDRIILSSVSGTVGRNDRVSFTYAFPEGTNGSVKVATSNKNITEPVTEGNTITLKGKAVGTATVTMTAHNGVKATYKLTVKNAPSTVKLAYGRYSVGVGEKLPGNVTLPTNTMASLTFTSLDESVITIDEKGTITAVGEGKAKVQAMAHNNVKGTSGEFTVYPAPVSVSLADGRDEYGVGETGTLTSTLSEGSVGAVRYTSSDDSILQVASDGKFTAMAPGRVTVTVTAYNGVSDMRMIAVVPAPDRVDLSRTSGTVGRLDTISFTYSFPVGTQGSAKVAISNKNIADMTVNGETVSLKTKNVGTATVTVTCHNGVKATYKLTVKPAPTSVKLSYSRTSFGIGEQLGGSVTLNNGAVASITFTSSDENVLTVDENGAITAVGTGKARIQATAHNKVKGTSAEITVYEAPVSVEIEGGRDRYGVGETGTFTVKLSEGSMGAYSFASSDTEVLKVDSATGKYSALKEGSAVVTVTAYNGVAASKRVTVVPAPDRVILSLSSATIGRNDMITTAYSFPEGTDGAVKVATSNKSIADFTIDGNVITVKGKAVGIASVTVTAHNGVKAVFKLTVKNAPTYVKISAERNQLGLGETVKTNVTLPANTAASLYYTSSDESVLTVDENGMVTAVGIGTAKIQVRCHNNVKGSTADITVCEAPGSVSIEKGKTTLGVGEPYTARAVLPEGTQGAYTWTSDNDKVLTIDEKTGVCKVIAVGTARIAVRTYNGKTDSVLITVCPAASRVNLSDSSVTLGVKEVYTVTCSIPDGTAAALKATASNGYAAAELTEDGKLIITPKQIGTCTITVKTHTGASTGVKVTVKAAPTSIKLSPSSVTLGVGEQAQTKYTLSSGSASHLFASTSDPSVAVMDENGLVTAVGVGCATVTVKTFNNKSATMTVTVKSAPTSVTISKDNLVLNVNQTYTLDASLSAGAAGSYEYSSSNASVVAVDAGTGKVKGLKVGSATITVKTYNGKTDTAKITVLKGSSMTSLIALAESKLGCPYVYASKGPYSFDCSGFTSYLYKTMYGISLSGSAYGQGYVDSKRFTVIKELELLQPGDILCFNTTETDDDLSDHVALYIGNSTFIHASQTKGMVIKSTFTSYYKRVFFLAFRVIG